MRVRRFIKPIALLVLVELVLLLASNVFFAVAEEDPEFPESNLYVTDFANVVPTDNLKEPNRVLSGLQQRTQIEVRVLLVTAMGNLSPQSYSEKVFRDWRVGAQSGKGVLVLFVTSNRAWQVRVTNELEGELPVMTLNEIGRQVAAKARGNYSSSVSLAVRSIVDELGRSRGFAYEDLANSDIPGNPVRNTNASQPPTLWKLLKLAGGVAISLVGGLLTLGLGISILRTIFFWNPDGEEHGWLRTVTTRLVLFAVGAGLIYYFWGGFVSSLKFGRLLGEGVAIFYLFLFPLFAIAVFIVLIFVLRAAGRVWAKNFDPSQRSLKQSVLIVIGLPLLLLLLPRSEVGILRSWEPRTPRLTQARNDSSGLLGRATNAYTVDNLGRVRTLRIEQAKIHNLKELSGLEDLTSLNTLQIKDTPLEGVQDVSSLTSLKSLRFSGTRITGIAGLDKLEFLEELEVDHIDLEGLHNLTALSKLKWLTLKDCHIDDLSQVGSLTSLETLFLDGTDVTDLSALAGLQKLGLLSIAGTKVTDLTPLRPLPIVVLLVRDTSLPEGHLRETFPHLLFVIDQDIDIEDGLLRVEEQFVSPAFRSFRNQLLLVLGVAGLLLWLLKLLPKVNGYWLFIMRRLFGKTVWGIVCVLVLLTIANLDLPIRVLAGAGLPDPQRLLLSWATFIAIVWLGMRPLLILAGETKRLSATRWSVVAHYFVRFAPAIAMFGPISYKVITNAIPTRLYFVNLVGFVLMTAIFGTPWLITGILVISGARRWSRKFGWLQKVAEEPGSIVEVPLRLTNKNIRYGGLNLVGLTIGSPESGHELTKRHVITAASAAALSRLPAESSRGVAGSIITIKRDDLSNLKSWEVHLLQRWVTDLHFKTISPVWLINDWFDVETSKAGGPGGFTKLQPLVRYLNGSEQRFNLGVTVFPLEQTEDIQQCLAANELIPRDHLESFQLGKLLSESFTPVAELLRSLFGQPHLADRLDVLARATEVATIFFVLALTTEYEARREQFSETERKKIDAGLKWTFKSAPRFGDWITLLITFSKRGTTQLASELKYVLNEEPLQASNLFRQLLEQAAGTSFPIGELITKRTQALELLRHMRNQLTAHGPVTEHTSPDLYRLALITTLDLLSSLPWSTAVVCKIEQGRCVMYQGLQTNETQATAGLSDGIFLRLSTSGTVQWIEADSYFKVSGDSIALFIGEKDFFNPLSGLRV